MSQEVDNLVRVTRMPREKNDEFALNNDYQSEMNKLLATILRRLEMYNTLRIASNS